ncbi:MAG: hypothetical protein ACRD51_01085, partial [Candidatus Acidiferrum sp.]
MKLSGSAGQTAASMRGAAEGILNAQRNARLWLTVSPCPPSMILKGVLPPMATIDEELGQLER